MNTSTLPHLLGEYLLNYEEKRSLYEAKDDVLPDDNEKEDEILNGSSTTTDEERKLKTSKAILAQRRQMEAEEKALKEREEKALYTLKLWNVVKDNERKRKQKMLKDRVNLQHQIIKKQDELHEALVEQQQREEKEQLQSPSSKCEKPRTHVTATGDKQQKKLDKDKATRRPKKKSIVNEHLEERPPTEPCGEEKPPKFWERDTFSEEDLSEFLEETMQDANFHELRHQPLSIQLEKLFGEKADSYLHPAIKERPMKALNPALAKTKGHHGATALWETLRDFSRQKLRNKDALILPDVKKAYACFTRECLRRHVTPVQRNFVSEEEVPVNLNVEESDLLKDVRFRRHRQELMYRIAHINKDKTRLLFQNSEPHYMNDMKTNNDLSRFYPQLSEGQDGPILPAITLNDGRQENVQLVHISSTNGISRFKETHVKKSNSKEREIKNQDYGENLVFLTEAKASCKGQFAKRLMKQDESSSQGNAVMQMKHNEQVSKQNRGKAHKMTPRLCEPLSMEALLDTKSTSLLGKRDTYFVEQKC